MEEDQPTQAGTGGDAPAESAPPAESKPPQAQPEQKASIFNDETRRKLEAALRQEASTEGMPQAPPQVPPPAPPASDAKSADSAAGPNRGGERREGGREGGRGERGEGRGEPRGNRPPRTDSGPREARAAKGGPRGEGGPRAEGSRGDGPRGESGRGGPRERGDRGDRRGPREGRPTGRGFFEGAIEIDIEKLISDSLYLDNQAHAVVSRMRDMDSGTKSQLRRLYGAVRRAVRAPEEERQHQFVMLRARLAYTIARHSLRSLDGLERLLLQVTRKNDAPGYERFKDLFEAIVAYNE